MAGDTAFLRHLFIANRWALFSAMAVSEQARLQLLGQQFDLQDTHYRNFYPATDRRIATIQGQPVGRLYILREEPMWKLIDLSIIPEVAGQGIGSQLIDLMLSEADAARRPISLYCDPRMPSFEVYKAKGFIEVRQEGADMVMERWPRTLVG